MSKSYILHGNTLHGTITSSEFIQKQESTLTFDVCELAGVTVKLEFPPSETGACLRHLHTGSEKLTTIGAALCSVPVIKLVQLFEEREREKKCSLSLRAIKLRVLARLRHV